MTRRVFSILADRENDLYVSAASLWDLSIKAAKGKLVIGGGSVRTLYQGLTIPTSDEQIPSYAAPVVWR